MEQFGRLVSMLRERRLGFQIDETMQGTHQFTPGEGPPGEHAFWFRATWGTEHLGEYLNPRSQSFLAGFLTGTVHVGGLCEKAACSGRLVLRYFQEASIEYTFAFHDPAGRRLTYRGEKVNIRPWNLHRSHTTCIGSITDPSTGQEISRSVVRFNLWSLPAFLGSFRLG